MKQKNHSLSIVAISGWVLSLILMFAYITHGWTAPTANPTANNVPPPINAGSAAQTKTGAFTINGPLDVNNAMSVNPTNDGTSIFSVTDAASTTMLNINSAADQITLKGATTGPALTLGSTAVLGPLTIDGKELEVTGSISATDTITATQQMCLAGSCINSWPTGEGGGVPSTGIILSTTDNNVTLLTNGFTQIPGAMITDNMMTPYFLYTKTP